MVDVGGALKVKMQIAVAISGLELAEQVSVLFNRIKVKPKDTTRCAGPAPQNFSHS